MDDFPFSTNDWSRVRDAALAVVNAILAEDEVLRASQYEELRRVLAELRAKYGDHPVLLETEADFSNDPKYQRMLYQEAIQQSCRAGLVTYSARMSLARVLLDDFDEPGLALAELKACEPEFESHGDEAERREWAELMVDLAHSIVDRTGSVRPNSVM